MEMYGDVSVIFIYTILVLNVQGSLVRKRESTHWSLSRGPGVIVIVAVVVMQ